MTKYQDIRAHTRNDVEILFLLIPLAIIIAFVIAAFFFWSVKSGQFDDMQGPAHSILMDDDSQIQPDEPVHESDQQKPPEA